MANGDKEWEFNLHEENLVHSEINFLKGQQWHVTNYGLLLYGAIVGLTQLEKLPLGIPNCWLVVLVVAVAIAALIVLCSLEWALKKARCRSNVARSYIFSSLYKPPPKKGRGLGHIFLFLSLALTVGAGVVSYFLVRQLCPALAIGVVLAVGIVAAAFCIDRSSCPPQPLKSTSGS